MVTHPLLISKAIIFYFGLCLTTVQCHQDLELVVFLHHYSIIVFGLGSVDVACIINLAIRRIWWWVERGPSLLGPSHNLALCRHQTRTNDQSLAYKEGYT